MPRTRPPYPPEFRRQILELVEMGRTPAELAREFERPPPRRFAACEGSRAEMTL